VELARLEAGRAGLDRPRPRDRRRHLGVATGQAAAALKKTARSDAVSKEPLVEVHPDKRGAQFAWTNAYGSWKQPEPRKGQADAQVVSSLHRCHHGCRFARVRSWDRSGGPSARGMRGVWRVHGYGGAHVGPGWKAAWTDDPGLDAVRRRVGGSKGGGLPLGHDPLSRLEQSRLPPEGGRAGAGDAGRAATGKDARAASCEGARLGGRRGARAGTAAGDPLTNLHRCSRRSQTPPFSRARARTRAREM
jgi:hypothetical protein